MTAIRLEEVSFAFHEAAPILHKVTLHLPEGFMGLVGENGAGKTTFLRLLHKELLPDEGRIRFLPPSAWVVLCPQSVEKMTEDIRLLAESETSETHRLRKLLGLEVETLGRWPTLSPGERKRWQIGAALAQKPDVLLLDEPTNHADSALRTQLLAALLRFSGVGIVVSHDRSFLSALTQNTLRLSRGEAKIYPGAYAAAREIWEAEIRYAWEERQAAQDEVKRAKRKLAHARRTRNAAECAQKNRVRDSDSRSLVAKTKGAWAEDAWGRQVTRLASRVERAKEAVPELPKHVEWASSVFLDFIEAPKPTLLSLHADTLKAGELTVLKDVHLKLDREERIRLEGPNGAGKTTLLRALLENAHLNEEQVLFLPQETKQEEATLLLQKVKQLPAEPRGRVLSLVAALGTAPARLLASSSPSPGEIRKLQLAFGLGQHVWLLILDEPTNHLDLPTIECLEKALSEYPGALLLVSHDNSFAAHCTTHSWRIQNQRIEMT